MGDSHAQAYAPALSRYATDMRSPVRLYYKAGCEFPVLMRPTGQLSRCGAWYGQAIGEIRLFLRAGDVLFLSSLHIPLLSPRWDRAGLASITPDVAEQRAAFTEAQAQLEMLSGSGVKIILEAPKPIFRSPPFRCSDWFNRRNPVCEQGFIVRRREELQRRADALGAMQRLAASVPGVSIWDPFPILCPLDPCQAFRGDRAIYHDDNHLNPYGTMLLYRAFTEAVAADVVR